MKFTGFFFFKYPDQSIARFFTLLLWHFSSVKGKVNVEGDQFATAEDNSAALTYLVRCFHDAVGSLESIQEVLKNWEQ